MDTKNNTSTNTNTNTKTASFTDSKNVTDLKSKKVAELIQIAKDLNVSGYSDLKKQELIFKIIEAQTKKDGFAFAVGVLEVLPDGYGFLRSEDNN